ncbi:MAG TPA: hypothetical protein VFZ21_09915 [Gemmatimonadaceae bacterium]|nr:hypothetical protein [Gemmatimonadaceae bacterium]
MMRLSVRARRGVALPAAIFALVLLSTLIVGALFVATEELRAGRSDVADQRTLAAAEWALEHAVTRWDPRQNTALRVGDRTELLSFAHDGDSVRVVATRTQPRAVWLAARATSRDGRTIPARRVVGGSYRLVGPTVSPGAALTSGGRVTVTSGGLVVGVDAAATASSARVCGEAPPASVAAVAVPDSADVCGETCGATPPVGLEGDPLVANGPPAADPAFSTFGDDTRATLSRRAALVLEPGTYVTRPASDGTECVVSDPMNWGDPAGTSPCADHFPIVHVRGDAVLGPGSVGQGMLLADGGVTLEAGARFAGIVIATNAIVVRGPGAEISGLALAANADGAGATRLEDGGAIRYGGCVARAAVLGAARLARTPERWWAELR